MTPVGIRVRREHVEHVLERRPAWRGDSQAFITPPRAKALVGT